MGNPKMSTVGDKLQRDLEKGAAMDSSPGDSKDKALRNMDEARVISYLLKLLSFFGLYEFFAEQGSPENQWQETKKIWIVSGFILPCNTGIIYSMSKADGGLVQAVLILTTLSFLLTFILVISPIAMPTLHMPNIKRFVLVCAAIITACSYLPYVASKMGTLAPTSIAAIFLSALFVSLITILFLIRLILATPPILPRHCEPLLATAPTT